MEGTVIESCFTVLILQINDEYNGILMNKKIDAVWLNIERIADLKGCSNRTVWCYIDKHRMHTVKQKVTVWTTKVQKILLLLDLDNL